MKWRLIILFLLLIKGSNLTAQVITTWAGNACAGLDSGFGGPATAACFGYPTAGSFDAAGNYYFAQNFGASKVLKIDTAGIITVVAGDGTSGFDGDGGPATAASIVWAWAVADSVGNLFIPDRDNHRVRKVDAATGIIHTIAGNGLGGHSGDGGPATAATLWPGITCTDVYGNVYVNDSGVWIRKISPAGIITTIAGNGIEATTGDNGPATSASINVSVLCMDPKGNLLMGGHGRLRKVNMITGIITTIAGNGITAPYTGDGPASTAQFIVFGLATDRNGNIYIADYGVGNSRVLKIDTFGWVSSLAGTGIDGFSGDNGPATAAQLSNPEGVAVDKCGNIYIADDANRRIRKIWINPTCSPANVNTVGNSETNIIVYPNPASNELTIAATVQITSVSISNTVGQVVITEQYKEKEKAAINVSHLPTGVYMVKVNEVYVQRFLKE